MIGKILMFLAIIQAIVAVLDQQLHFLGEGQGLGLILGAICKFTIGFGLHWLVLKARGY